MKKITFLTIFLFQQVAIIFAQDNFQPQLEYASIIEETTNADSTIVNEIKSKIDLGGSIDAYFRGNLNGDRTSAPSSSFGNLPGFSLGMANCFLMVLFLTQV